MPLMTRCLHCRTVFRVTPEQLRAHGGQVRCGRCLQVFNALEALVPDVPAVADTESPGAAAPVTGDIPLAETPLPEAESFAVDPSVSAVSDVEAPLVPPAIGKEDASAGSHAAVEAAVTAEVNADAGLIELLPEPAVARAQDELSPEPVGAEAREAVIAPGPEAEQAEATAAPAEAADNPFMPGSATEAEAGPAPRRRGLVAASVLLAIALVAQAIYLYRGDIAARHPVARQWLEAACGHFGCAVPLPQLPKSVLIEASDLQLMDPARPDRIQLTATLRNHAGHAVAYPALDLVLTNANDHTLARRIFLPAEYLGTGRDPRAGLAAHAELTVQRALDTGNLGAAGFRLAVLAAPH
jgi:predicted Zn finger-like uncharacterized protein